MVHFQATDPVTPDDHSGWVTVTAALFLSWSLSTLAVRAWIRLRLHGPWGYDDSLITTATVLAVCQAISVFVAIHHQYGLRYVMMAKVNVPAAEKALFASQIFYVASICTSKLSTSFLVARLTRWEAHIRAVHGVSALTIIWGVASIIALAIRGDISQPWATVDGTEALFVRWMGIETISMLLEVALYALSIYLLWGLQMSQILKTVILVAFAARLAIIPITCLRLYYLNPSLNPDLSFSTVYANIITQVVLHYTLIAATIPCTKPFMRPFNRGFLPSSEDPSQGQSHSRGNHFIFRNNFAIAKPIDNSESTGNTSSTAGSSSTAPLNPRSTAHLNPRSTKGPSLTYSRELVRELGDSDFRGDRNAITTQIESNPIISTSRDRPPIAEMHRLNPNEMVIRQTTEWDVQREPAEGS